jgi:hypothetical protein
MLFVAILLGQAAGGASGQSGTCRFCTVRFMYFEALTASIYLFVQVLLIFVAMKACLNT